jgi:predicted O-methyltransferase YrrM
MTATALGESRSRSESLFVLAAFCGAAMVFMIEPMIAKLVLPQLGGSPAVWNTCVAFFQIALLAGYGYAHLLQRLGTVRRQVAVHLAVLVIAAVVLPVRITHLMGEPSVTSPVIWLLGTLTLSLGLPFAALSATAPLVQAWHARTVQREGAAPWTLYAASNVGSLLALLAYPVIVEPLTGLTQQRYGWSLAYLGFVVVMAALAFTLSRSPAAAATRAAEATARASWRNRLIWIGLAALPSSLMLGVTAHLTTDVASAPFLWVAPLALYLITFIIAFQSKPAISPKVALLLGGLALPLCLAIFHATQIGLLLAVHLLCFFLTALVCHQTLVARRPDTAQLTEFYLCLSIGGVVGGAFNAFLAPVIFNSVLEYPLALVLACLARPFGSGPLARRDWLTIGVGLACAVAAVLLIGKAPEPITRAFLAGAAAAAFLVRDRALAFLGVVIVLAVASHEVGDRAHLIRNDRSFFGVVRQIRMDVPGLGGSLRVMAHGSTIHGAQAQAPAFRCQPLVYYARETPIGQVFTGVEAARPAIRVGAVGLGTGSVAAYNRAGDHFTFFEIDPLVIKIARDPTMFSYTTECARGRIDYVLGDARLTLAKQAPGQFDILLIDAFSSDAVPAHLMTVEAMRGYLARIKPDGVVIMHLSNRNLDLPAPARAIAAAAGGHALFQHHLADPAKPPMWEAGEDALIVARSPEALAAFASDSRWTSADPRGARPWTDDYTNLLGAFISKQAQKLRKPA